MSLTNNPQPGDALASVVCPECGAVTVLLPNGPTRTQCWLCRRELGATSNALAATAYVSPRPLQFGVGTLMLLVTLVAVFLGLVMTAPPLAVLFLILGLPALIRTVYVVRRREQPATLTDKFWILWTSLGAIFVAWVAAAGAFGVVCTAGFLGSAAALDALGKTNEAALGYDLMIGALLGAAAALVVAGGLLTVFWKRPTPATAADSARSES